MLSTPDLIMNITYAISLIEVLKYKRASDNDLSLDHITPSHPTNVLVDRAMKSFR